MRLVHERLRDLTAPGPRLATAVAVGSAVVVGLAHLHTGDVRVYRAGGQAVLHGGDLYGLRVGAYGFSYPPFAAVLFATVAWLPLPAVFAVLTVASAGALYVVLRRSLPDSSGWGAVLTLALLALAQPVTATLAWGQVNLLLAALVLHDLLVRRSGVLVGIATAVKLVPGVFVLHLLLCGRRDEARRAALSFLIATAVGVLVAPTASWRYWTHEVVAGSGVGGFDHEGNQSLRGLAERTLGAGPGTAVWLVLAAPVLAVGLVLARRAARGGDEVAGAGIAGLTACLVSPVAWIHHWVWCIPCLARLPVPARLTLGTVLVLSLTFGPVLGAGYPVIVVLVLATRRWWTRAIPASAVAVPPRGPQERSLPRR